MLLSATVLLEKRVCLSHIPPTVFLANTFQQCKCCLCRTIIVITTLALYGAGYCDQFVLSVCLFVYLSVCLSASKSLELLDQSSQIFLCRSLVAMTQSSSGTVAIHYVLPVLCMTSRLAIVGHMVMHGRLNLLTYYH